MESGNDSVQQRVWVASLAERIASFLPPNDVACSLRLLNKASAALFCGPQHKTVHLSQPCLPDAFARRWGVPEATRSLSLDLRQELVDLTATSGVIANLQVAVEASGIRPYDAVARRAVKAGHLHVLEWLRERSGAEFCYTLQWIAAAHGRRDILSWLLRNGVEFQHLAVENAAKSGNFELLRWVLLMWHKWRPLDSSRTDEKDKMAGLMASAVLGCDLPALQQLFADWANGALSSKFQNNVDGDEEPAFGRSGLVALEEMQRELMAQQHQLQRELRALQGRIMALRDPRLQSTSSTRRGKRGPRQEPQSPPQRPEDAEQSVASRRELADAQAAFDDLEDKIRQLRQRHQLLRTVGWAMCPFRRASCLAHAAASRTPDWREKFEWLEGLGFALGGELDRASVAWMALSLSGRPAKTTATVIPRGSATLANAVTNGSSADGSTSGASFTRPPPPEVQVVWQYHWGGDHFVERLRWLAERGYPVGTIEAVRIAAELGNASALLYVASKLRAREQGAWMQDNRPFSPMNMAVQRAAETGSWEALEGLRALGVPLYAQQFLHSAARYGHLRVLQWWDGLVTAQQQQQQQQAAPPEGQPVEQHHQQMQHPVHAAPAAALPSTGAGFSSGPAWMGADEWGSAAQSGNLEMLQWMYARCGGKPRWDDDTFMLAAGGGNEEALEWLVEHGCPIGDDGEPYLAAAEKEDMATLRCLLRLGCPWGRPGYVFGACTFSHPGDNRWFRFIRANAEMLLCLLEEGCPVDWPAAEAKARERRRHDEESDYRDAKPDEAVELVLRLAQLERQAQGNQ